MPLSEQLFQAAQDVIAGGVNSPVRAFNGVGGCPVFIERAEGPYIYAADGQQYIDYVGSWGPMILGHNHPVVRDAVLQACRKGLSFGAPTEIETAIANKIRALMPSIERLRMVNSGTEATMSAIRLARGYTGREKIVKFAGCYHGHSDSLLVKAGSGALTLGVPSSPGIPQSLAALTLSATFNDLEQVQQLFVEYGDDIAAIIVEPVAGNMNCIPPLADFLPGLRRICDQYQSLLIFDEVMTGFRVASGGAQAHYGVKPDLTTLGKIIGGGMPVGAFGGKRLIMEQLAPFGPVYQAGTLSGNPVAMSAGLAVLNELSKPGFYLQLHKNTEQLLQGMVKLAKNAGVPLSTNQVGSMFGLFFSQEPNIQSYQQVMACNSQRFKSFFHGMLQAGIYLAPSAYESAFLSAAHDAEVIAKTLSACEKVFSTLMDI